RDSLASFQQIGTRIGKHLSSFRLDEQYLREAAHDLLFAFGLNQVARRLFEPRLFPTGHHAERLRGPQIVGRLRELAGSRDNDPFNFEMELVFGPNGAVDLRRVTVRGRKLKVVSRYLTP